MAVPGLPSADSLLASIAALRRTLTTEESTFRSRVFVATSTDGKVKATANGMVEVLSVEIALAAWPPAAQADLTPSLRDACSTALTQANNDTKPRTATSAAGYTLTGIPNFNQPPPATPNFQSSDADFTALIRAQEPIIAAKRFQGISGPVTAEVDGGLTITSLVVAEPVLEQRETLEMHVVLALNLALDKAKRLFEEAVKKRIDDGLDPKEVTSSAGCLWAHGSLQLADRVKVKKQDGTYAPVVNAGSTTTNVGVEAQTGDLWSRSAVVLRDRSRVNGNLRTMSTLTRHNQTVVTGTITENGFILRIPRLTLTVTFPPTDQGPVNVAPDQTRTIAPGSFGDVTVGSRATLFLSKGTYFFKSFTVEPQAKISCSSTTGQVVVHVRNGFTFRGSIIEKTGGRPKFFVSVHGSSMVALGAPFTGTLVALNALVDFATVGAPGHTGAFYAKDITVQPDNTIIHFPFLGPPTFTSP